MTPAGACRNCGAAAPWNYCPNCGQETAIALPSAFAFLREAAGRYIRFDGRMWRSLHALLFRPGFLTANILPGAAAATFVRRASSSRCRSSCSPCCALPPRGP
jgi:rRNA maturation protein Nop10